MSIKETMQLIKFSSLWCGPCKSLSSNLTKLDLSGLSFQEVDIDKEPSLSQQHNVRGIPTLILLDSEGNELRRLVGMQSIPTLETFLKGN